MARLRLFAHLREAAGSGSIEVDGATVGEVLAVASGRFGPEFEAALPSARIWVNGAPADTATDVGDLDEVAVLPPVSGGAQVMGPVTKIPATPVVALALAGLLFLDAAFFVAAAVGVLAIWAWDISRQGASPGAVVSLPPALVGIVGGVVAPLLLIPAGRHLEGVGLAVAVAVAATLVHAVIRPDARSVEGIGATLMVSVVVAASAASLTLVRLASGGTSALWVLLAVTIVSVLASFGSDRVPGLDVLDPLSAGAIGAVVAGLVVALVLGLAVVPYLLVSMVLALALIAGRSLGSLARTGRVLLVDAPPGLLAPLDGPVLAAAVLLHSLVAFL